MKVTFVIPLKDAAESCHRTLGSIALQHGDYVDRIIVVENGSQSFVIKPGSLNTEVHRLEEGSRSRSRNFGAEISRTEFIAFADADVVLPPFWLSTCLASFDENTLAVQSPIIPASDQDNFLFRLRWKRSFFRGKSHLSLERNPEVLNSAAFVVRSDAFSAIGGFDPQLPRFEDSDFTFRLLELPGIVKGIRTEPVHVYFEGNLWNYFLREFERGYSVVKLHEKWTHGGVLVAARSLMRNMLKLPLRGLKARNGIDFALIVLEGVYFIGNFIGLVRGATRSSAPKKSDYRKRGKVVIQ